MSNRINNLSKIAMKKLKSMTKSEQEEHWKKQRENFVEGQTGLIESDKEYFLSRGLDTD